MQTIRFEDQGQDFLEWDIDQEGVVVDSRPFQRHVWCGTQVQDVAIGQQPTVITPHVGVAGLLNYRVVHIRQANPFADQNGMGAVDVESRLHCLQRFDLIQCRIALEVPHLQKSVEKRLRSRIRKLERHEG
ncbi:hypothetical protein [Alkalilimnicola sp. S0819]|uniref:hypothetical protein n=1 Tax=Alkalilimnicola sp. S0819 TaxID=2613922 RepID=UPI001869C4E0|nr:hypothetical protein [Alkalilimnicola sp. S0819]